MSFNSVKSTFQTILNRSDCSDAQATAFVLQAIGRAQRDLKQMPNTERQSIVTTTGPVSFIAIPPDMIELIDVIVTGPDGHPRVLQKLPYRDLVRIPPQAQPHHYARLQSTIQFAGPIPTGWTIQLLYYGQFSDMADGTQDNELTASSPDLLVYGALSFAADLFAHPSAQQWEARYQQIVGQVQALASDLEWNGGALTIKPMYEDDCR